MLHSYSLLRGIVAKDLENSIGKERTHHNLIVLAGDRDYQVNIDIQSLPRPNVKFFMKNDFNHPILSFLEELPDHSLTSLNHSRSDYRLDYLRSKIFSSGELAQAQPEEALSISNLLDSFLQAGASVFILGDFYDDEAPKRDRMPHGLELQHKHHFLPSRGLHEIHMNQGVPSTMSQSQDNGLFQDGAIFLKRPDQTVHAFFFMFDNQCTVTDAEGNCC